MEDDEQVSAVICAVIKRAGHEVHQFGDGAVAWHHLETHWADYGLMLFDVNMPGLTGIELARRVRQAGCSTPLVVMSGRLSSIELDAISECRVDRVLPKPFAMADLLSTLHDCLVVAPAEASLPGNQPK